MDVLQAVQPAPATAARPSVLSAVAALLLASGYLAFLLAFYAPAISTPDANGYFAQGRQIAEGGRSYFETESVLQFIPPHWLSADGTRYYCKYPPGLPVLAAGVRRLFGPDASLLINPVLAALTLFGVYAVCARWVGGWWGVLAAALVATSPSANQQALFAFAHTAVAFLLVWGLYFAARWEQSGRAGWLLAAALFFGAIPTLRYPEALFCAALGLFVLLNLKRSRSPLASLVAASVGVAAPLGALLIRNQFAFGAFWRTGYAASNEQTGFGWDYFVQHAGPYLQSLQSDGAGVLIGVGLVGLAALCAQHATWRRGVLLVALVVPITLLYMAYYWGAGGGAMRFFVPVFFVFAIATASALQLLARSSPAAASAAGVALLLYMAAWGLPESVEHLRRLRHTDAALAEATRQVRTHVQPGSIIVADQLLQQQLDFAGGWRLVDEAVLTGRGPQGGPGGPGAGPRGARAGQRAGGRGAASQPGDANRPNPMAGQGIEERMRRFAGLDPDERRDAVVGELRQWAARARSADGAQHDTRLYWIGAEADLSRFRTQFRGAGRFFTVASFELPAAPAENDRFAPGMPGPPGGGFGGPIGPGFGPPGGGLGGGFGPRGGGPGGFGGGPGGGPPGANAGPWNRGGQVLIVEWQVESNGG